MVDGVNSTASATSNKLTTQRNTIADNFDTFLQLLLTQLKNQNPLEPMDTNQFTQQLVQFTSVEQQLQTNEFLEAMMQSTQNGTNTQAVSYIGKMINASGTTADIKNGQASWLYKFDSPAENTMVTIKDASGNVVFNERLSLEAGTDQIVWDGTTSMGERLSSGRFTITIDARTAEGAYIPVTTEMMGVVEGVDVSGTEPYLLVGGRRIPVSAVTAVGAPPPMDEAA